MNYVLTNSSGAVGNAIASATGRFVAAASNIGETAKLNRQYRKTVSELSALTSAELADLGLSRSSIRATAYMAVYG